MKKGSTALTMPTLRDKLTANADVLGQYLGAGVDAHHYIAGIVEDFERNPALYTCEPGSIFEAVRKLALTGLRPGLPPGQEEAYLVPYGRQCQLLVSYRGLIELARRGGTVRRVVARTVHEGDRCEFDDGLEPWVKHTKVAEKRTWANMTHVYAHFLLDDNLRHLEVLTKSEVEDHKRRYVKATGKDSPWQTDPLAMARKTVIRRAFASGQIPLSQTLRQMVAADDLNEMVIDSTVVSPMTGNPVHKLAPDPDGAVKATIDQTGMDPAHQPSEAEIEAAKARSKANLHQQELEM